MILRVNIGELIMVAVGRVFAPVQLQQVKKHSLNSPASLKGGETVSSTNVVQNATTGAKLDTSNVLLAKAHGGVVEEPKMSVAFKEQRVADIWSANFCKKYGFSPMEMGGRGYDNLFSSMNIYLYQLPEEKRIKVLQQMATRLGVSPSSKPINGLFKMHTSEDILFKGRFVNAFFETTQVKPKAFNSIYKKYCIDLGGYRDDDAKFLKSFLKFSKCAEQELAVQKEYLSCESEGVKRLTHNVRVKHDISGAMGAQRKGAINAVSTVWKSVESAGKSIEKAVEGGSKKAAKSKFGKWSWGTIVTVFATKLFGKK